MIRLMVGLFIFANLSIAHAAIAPLKITPLGKPDAPVAGTFNRNAAGEPDSLNPMHINDGYTQRIADYVNEGLLYLNPDTNVFQPQLAESYEISKDFLTYTFHLRKSARFSDGSPVTADDVKFSIDAVKDPAYKAQARMPFYDDVESVTIVDPVTVQIKMKKKYYLTLQVLATREYTPILSKKMYVDPKKKFESGWELYGSGPYKVEAYNRGKNIMLVRDPQWWGNDFADQKGRAKFEHVNWRFIKDQNLEIEMVKKGQIDYMEPIRAENFEKKAVGEPFGTTIQKVQVENKRPKDYGFIAWNEKSPLFKDRDVRVALAHLLNRKLLIEKFQFGKSVEGVGPWYYNSPFTSPAVKPISYDPAKAKALLKKAGWDDKEKRGVLQKTIEGKPVEFRFALLLPNRDVEKYFTLYKEDLKKAGIDMEIKLIEWNTFTKLLDEQKFDAVTLSWGGGAVEEDPKQIWHSESAKAGGSNFISYSNKEVDSIIDKAREEMNAGKRKLLWQKMSKLVADDAPYAFLFNAKYDLYLVNKHIAYDKPTYTYDLSVPYFYLAPQ
ncbi:MAG: ABC transporter substrate-binding protein [Bdellovibrionales bacterium]